MSTRFKSVFKNKKIAAKLADIHDKYVGVPADKASNNVVFACTQYYIQCLIQWIDMGSNGEQNKTYQATNFSK